LDIVIAGVDGDGFSVSAPENQVVAIESDQRLLVHVRRENDAWAHSLSRSKCDGTCLVLEIAPDLREGQIPIRNVVAGERLEKARSCFDPFFGNTAAGRSVVEVELAVRKL